MGIRRYLPAAKAHAARIQDVALVLSVALAHYGPAVLADTPKEARVWFYVLRGVEGAVLCAVLAATLPKGRKLALVACLWGLFEEAQTAACGMAKVSPGLNSGMCLELLGPWPYAGIAAALIVFALTRAKRDG